MINTSVMLVLMLSFISLPYISNRDISFGVKIPKAEFNNLEIKEVRRRFILILLITGISATIITALYGRSEGIIIAIYFAYIILSIILFVYSNSKVKIIKSESNWEIDYKKSVVVDTNFRKNNIVISNSFYIINVLILALSILILSLNNIAFTKDVIVMIVVEVFMIFMFIFINTSIKYSKNSFSKSNTEESIKRAIESNHIMSVALFVIALVAQLAVIASTFTEIGFYNAQSLIYILIVFEFLVVIYLVLKFIRLQRMDKGDSKVIESNDDEYWKYGLFYYNKNDPSLFVKKRTGIGFTLNHARKSALVFYLIIVLILVLSIVFEL